ncbi:PIG-L family deacetylase [Saccharopolyspora hattusasensis]|uniref:PIG-L family deacetylase n=1 Tax=Saccharopolyspora hattusasensis TaxID=1128679 RepID=UPI003D995CC5
MRGFAAAIALLLIAALVDPAAAAQMRSHLQVVAHPDDDILFMNPDLAISIRSGATVTTVFLTAGESDVRPAGRYAARRQAGARAAFAAMAGAPDVWDRAGLPLPGGRQAEVQTLRDRPTVRLVFLNLPDDNDPHTAGGRHALTRLWHDAATRVEALRPDGSVLAGSSIHDRASVIDALGELYRRFAPTIVRTHDPEPDPRYQPQWGPHHNHPDHVMTARFAELAMRSAGSAHLIHYRDYNVADAPPNLPAEIVAGKREIFARYAAHDAEVSMGEPYATWLRSMRHRWPWNTNWATTGRDGEPVYVYVRGGKLLRGNGSRESVVDTGGFVPRAGSPGFAGPDTLVVQDRTGAIFLKSGPDRWQDLGSPPTDAPLGQVGPPAAVAAPGGRVLVAVRNARGGVSVRFADQAAWTDLGGTGVDDAVSVLLAGTGEAHVFATAQAGLLHWRLDGTGSRLVAPPETHHPAGSVAVARGHRAFAAFREAATGRVVVLGEHAGWSVVATAATTATPATSDPALAVLDGDIPVVAVRDGEGRIVVLGTTMAVLPGRIVGRPAFTSDGRHLVALGDDGRMHLTSLLPEGRRFSPRGLSFLLQRPQRPHRGGSVSHDLTQAFGPGWSGFPLDQRYPRTCSGVPTCVGVVGLTYRNQDYQRSLRDRHARSVPPHPEGRGIRRLEIR